MEYVFHSHIRNIWIDPEMYDTLNAPHGTTVAISMDESGVWRSYPKETILVSHQLAQLRCAEEAGYRTAYHKRINDKGDMNEATKSSGSFSFLIVQFTDTTNIPLELLLAKLPETSILKHVSSMQDGEVATQVMERGSDGFVISTSSTDEIIKINQFLEKETRGKVTLTEGCVVCTEHIGMGFRSCIDTTTLMEKNEGMLVGSLSHGALLVSSETHRLPYMDLRPFRVNAGAVHSYVWASDGETRYMTELRGGTKLLCVDTEGNTREVTVGRIETEARPLLLIEVEADGRRINVVVQDDWHIRLLGPEGAVLNASAIKPGDRVLAYLCQGGRHVGIQIKESIDEK